MFQTLKEFDDPRIVHGFFGRKGGTSEGIYKSLNTSFVASDSDEAVRENRNIIARALDIKNISTLYQHHSADCVVIDEPLHDTVRGDALVTSKPGVALGIQTADCGPVLFWGESEKGPVVAAAHAGWGGAVKGVLENTIAKMVEQGARKDTIRAAIGPSIGPESYEVSEDFLKPFQDKDAESILFFKPGSQNKFWFDLPSYIKFRLKRACIENVFDIGVDTYKEENDYFSFRRATHRGEENYGRQLSVIAIR